MRLELVTVPGVEPLLLADARLHMRVTNTAEDALITRLIVAARRHVEKALRRKLITQHWRFYFDTFPGCSWWHNTSRPSNYSADFVLLDVAPVTVIDSVKYLDTAGVLQTLAPSVYQLVPEAPVRLTLAYNQVWPDIRGDREGVRIEVTSGYGAAGANVPEDIIAAMLLLIDHLFSHRTENTEYQLSEMPMGAQHLLAPYVVHAF